MMRRRKSNTERSFRAFISFRHQDNMASGRRWAEWLHSQLETFKIPTGLAGMPNRRFGSIPKSLYPVFLDRAELGASHALTASIHEALDRSEALIVICTPGAAKSQHVEDEIRYFQNLGRGDRIFSLIVDGEPNATAPEKERIGIKPDLECFPKGLRGNIEGPTGGYDFIAIDLRPGFRVGQGYTDAKSYRVALKRESKHTAAEIREMSRAFGEQLRSARLALVAGIIGIRLSDLIDRDAARRARRLQWLSLTLFAVLLLVFASGTKIYFASMAERSAFSRSDFLQAIKLVEAGETSQTLAYLARAIRTNPDNSAAVARLYALLVQRSWQLPLHVPLRHGASIPYAQFSPDGTKILTGSKDSTARLWSVATGKPITSPMPHSGKLRAPEFDSDGQRVIVSLERNASVCSAGDGRVISNVRFRWDPLSIHFTLDGKYLLTAGRTPAAVLTDTQDGQVVRSFQTSGDGVGSAVVSPNGQLIATLSWTNSKRDVSKQSVQLFDVNWGIAKATLFEGILVSSLEFSPDSLSLLAVYDINAADPTRRHRTAEIWNVVSGKKVCELLNHDISIDEATFSSDGTYIITTSYQTNGNACLWNAFTGSPVTGLVSSGTPVGSAELSKSGELLLVAETERDSARIWSTWSNRPYSEPMRHKDWIRSAHFSPDNSKILTSAEDGSAVLWTALNGIEKPLTINIGSDIRSVRFSPSDACVLTVSADNAVSLWDSRGGGLVAGPLRHEGEVFSGEFNKDGSRIVTASGDKTACIWDTKTGKRVYDPLVHAGRVLDARFSCDGSRVFTRAEGEQPKIWDAANGRRIDNFLGQQFYVLSASLSTNGAQVVTVAGDRSNQDAREGDVVLASWDELSREPNRRYDSVTNIRTRLWDIASGRLLSELPAGRTYPGHVEFSVDDKRIVGACGDDVARVWTRAGDRWLFQQLLHRQAGNAGYMAAAHFSPSGRLVVTGSQDYSARVWNAATGQPVTEPLRHGGPLQDATFSSDGRRVVTASDDGTARVWDVDSGEPLTDSVASWSPDRSGDTVRLSHDGCRLACMVSKGVLEIWDLLPPVGDRTPGWLPDLAEVVAGCKLNDKGVLSPNDPEILFRLQVRLQTNRDKTFWGCFGRWFFADRVTRARSPQSR